MLKKILDEFNSISPNLEFTLEQVQNNILNVLDITIKWCNAETEWQFIFSIYRKPKTTDCIIPNDSCHPIDHRLACFRFLCNQLYTKFLLPKDKEIETQIISIIIFKNHFNLNILDHVNYRNKKHRKKEESSMYNNWNGYLSIIWEKEQNL